LLCQTVKQQLGIVITAKEEPGVLRLENLKAAERTVRCPILRSDGTLGGGTSQGVEKALDLGSGR
jgi:hypothetical protein